MGARKISEMLGWCQDAGVEMATVYLLSAENLTRDPDQLTELLEIITDVVEELCAPQNKWSVRSVGDLDLLPDEVAERMRQAVKSAPSDAGFHVNVAVGYGGRQEITDAVRTLLNKELANGASAEQLVQAVTVDAISENLLYLGAARPRPGDPDLGGAAVVRVPALAERLFGDVVHRRLLARVPAGGLPARAARLRRAKPAVWAVVSVCPSDRRSPPSTTVRPARDRGIPAVPASGA